MTEAISHIGHYDRDGNPLTLMEWANLYGDKDYRLVAIDTVAGSFISTVWLGVDLSGQNPPLIFETQIFDGKHDGEKWRYPTEDQALSGHDRIVYALQEELRKANV